ncbi:C6 transcription factor [Neofusicoccum parvum]|uniref:C6 transcription factor n=1 Tax=Neofusicoccum parvum TaxID=310453 RepID=A0ACB5S575_9PEZI|nr:C6 transcription factor [Neofusicoccum parvum]
MTRCMFNAAIILMYQRLTIPPKGLEHVFEPWYHAIQRCIDSANDITAAIRSVDDFDLETTNPQLTLCIFVAARFLIVHAKHFNLEIPRNLDLLVYALKTSGQRWPISHRQEKVIRTALAEYKIPLSISSLPAQFFDLQYSALDIDEALRGIGGGGAAVTNFSISTVASIPVSAAAAGGGVAEIDGGDDGIDVEGLQPHEVLLDK